MAQDVQRGLEEHRLSLLVEFQDCEARLLEHVPPFVHGGVVEPSTGKFSDFAEVFRPECGEGEDPPCIEGAFDFVEERLLVFRPLEDRVCGEEVVLSRQFDVFHVSSDECRFFAFQVESAALRHNVNQPEFLVFECLLHAFGEDSRAASRLDDAGVQASSLRGLDERPQQFVGHLALDACRLVVCIEASGEALPHQRLVNLVLRGRGVHSRR